MEALKSELERKRKLKSEEFSGKKYVKRSEIDAVRQKRLNEEQERINIAKGKVASEQAASEVAPPAEQAPGVGGELPAEQAADNPVKKKERKEKEKVATEDQLEVMSREEVIRRLRVLGQPATLFGEDEEDRHQRLIIAAKNISVDDFTGGQQSNEMQLKLKNIQTQAAKQLAAKRKEEKGKTPESAEADLEAAFESAAAEVAKKRAEENMTVGERIIAFFKHIMLEWKEEIDKMEDDYLVSMGGKLQRATFELSLTAMKSLYKQLKRGTCPDDLQRGLWLILLAMQRRDYREAMDVYLRISIGNAPWPIGVTMVGIHERSAREKIYSNSQAHIMHDEASRKFLQAVKRCITFCQRRFPANPSRAVDFNLRVFGDELKALHESEARGEEVDIGSKDFNIPLDMYGNYADGWRAQDRDNRTLSAVLRSAYKHEDDVKKSSGERQLVMK